MALSSPSGHLEYCLDTSKVDMEIMLLLKSFNELFANYPIPINTTFESVKYVSLSSLIWEQLKKFL